MKIHYALVVFATMACLPAKAQEIPSTDERISKIENTLSKLPRVSGFVNLRYQYNTADDANSFDVRRARLDFRGDIVPKFGYRLQVDFANNPKILDAYVDWKINGYFNVRAGQYKIPFSLENPYSPTNLETMDNSLVITALSGYSDVSGVSANGRDAGIGFSGNLIRRKGFSIINYSAGIFNGAGINRTDANKSKDFSGILTIHPVQSLALGVYHYNGRAGEQGGTSRRIRTGAGVKYDDGRWLARSEYIRGRTGGFKSEGAYAVFGYFVQPKLQTVLKYDYFKRDLSDNNTRRQNYTAGLNYLPVANIRLQLNYSYRTSAGIDNHYHYVGTQVIGMF